PSIIRGMTPEEIRDVLALPAVPSMITIVTVPVGTCVLVAKGAAVEGWGRGGTAQAYAAGTPSGPNCAGLQFLPEEDYINQQAIGTYALLYGPRAGGGNAARSRRFSIRGHTRFPSPIWTWSTRSSICSTSAIRRHCARLSYSSTARSTPMFRRWRLAQASFTLARCASRCGASGR